MAPSYGKEGMKMFVRTLCFIMVLMTMGCYGGPKANYVRKYDPVMDKNGGVVLLVDVCRQVDSIEFEKLKDKTFDPEYDTYFKRRRFKRAYGQQACPA
ncbi:hypothetical protein [Desulfosarcina ovata]|nr:hypothetical protein [Desulfosarcina ovata]